MKIECKLKREGGTHVELGSNKYHFAPDADNVHVCDVADEAHQDRFLSITEGYRLYRKGQAAATIEQAQPKPVAAPVAVVSAAERESLKFPDTFTIGDAEIALSDVIAQTMQANDMDIDLWSDLTAEEQSAKIEAQLDAMQDAADAAAMEALMASKEDGSGSATPAPGADDTKQAAAAAPADVDAERAALVEQYQKLNGKKPHHKWDNAKIRAEIAKG